MIEPGRYRHFKGNEYDILHVATHTETGEELVIYKSVSSGKIHARPVSMFTEEVSVDGTKVPRFERVDA